jgi:DedD protein
MMDRALKERIIGAAVLVLFVVLVVPVFLDGPPDDSEIVSERVPLPGQADQESRTVVLERDRKDPVPAGATPPAVVTDPAPQPVIVEEKPASPQPVIVEEKPASPPPEAAEIPRQETAAESKKPAPAPSRIVTASPTGMWAVQLGSFGNQDNAEKLAADLRKQGFAAFLSQLSADAGQLHRVRIGPQKDRESAEAMAERLKKAGHTGQVVPHP